MSEKNTFTIYPAIDLRAGRVVRLMQGDLQRETAYEKRPGAAALRWIRAGASWLHVVNLDAAFGLENQANRDALDTILQTAGQHGVRVQFGGGLRSLAQIEAVLAAGVARAIIGTAAIEDPDLIPQALDRCGPERLAVGIDARGGRVRTRGWVHESHWSPIALGKRLAAQGIRSLIFTNIARDGAESGIDLRQTRQLAVETNLGVIASGGAASLKDIRAVKAAGLEGLIIGRALYEGRISLQEALAC